MSLPRDRSLKESRDFARLRREAKPKIGRFLLMSAAPAASPDPATQTATPTPTLYGVITPKYLGKAHDRNRLRRRLRAIIAAADPDVPGGLHVVTLARRGAAKASFQTLEAEWRKLAARLGLLRGGNTRRKPSPRER